MSEYILNFSKNEEFQRIEFEPLIHIYLQQAGRRKITIIQGLSLEKSQEYLKILRKRLCCTGSIIQHKDFGIVMQLTGDQRDNIANFLLEHKYQKSNFKIHGI